MSQVASRIVVIGGGGHAKVLISVLRKTSWKILGYTDAEARGALLQAPYLGDDRILPDILRGHPDAGAILGVGKISVSPTRLRLHACLESLGFALPVIVSPHALVNTEVDLGAGTVVFDGAVINTGTVAGRSCIVNTNATLEHDCNLGDDVHIAPGATVSGGVNIGNDCVVGAGAVVIQGVSICGGCLIGAGSVVTADLTAPGTYVGAPARSTG
jgi:sugar O-acyltransferase (sialic acid O-acetyltransferase NeuD family)